MPITRQKHIRYYALDRCFRNPTGRYYIEDLLKVCNHALEQKDCKPVSERTIKNDLNEFEDAFNTIIEHIPDGNGRIYYRYADSNFSIEKAPITDAELAQLKDTVLMLSRFRGLPQFGWMEQLLTEIETKLHIDGHTESVIGFDSNNDIVGLEYLEPLFENIINEQAIELRYKPFHLDEIAWTLHPYFIKQHNNRWFLFALNDADSTIVNVALDRIVSIAPSNKKYIKNADINFNEYFDDIIGVTIPADQKPQTILLRFTPQRLPYVISKPLHQSQKLRNRERGLIEITVIPNRELTAQILWFGNDVEVLQPTSLRQEIQEIINKMQEIYNQ